MCDVNTVRALPKLNLLDRFGAGLFKKFRDKEVGDNLESEEQNYQQHPSANLKSTSHGSMAGEDLRGSDAFCPFTNYMEQPRRREDATIFKSNLFLPQQGMDHHGSSHIGEQNVPKII